MVAWPAGKKTMLHDGCSTAAATPATASTDTAGGSVPRFPHTFLVTG